MLKTKELTIGAMGCCISVLLLLICSVIPTGKLSLGFLASFVPCILNIESKSPKTALISVVSSAVIAALMLPKSGLAGVIIIFYCICFCYYPSLKSIIERKNNLVWEWILKEIYFIAISIVIKLVTESLGLDLYNIFISAVILTAYDVLLSYVISYYIRQISPRIQKSK